jgi:hypothetical protein
MLTQALYDAALADLNKLVTDVPDIQGWAAFTTLADAIEAAKPKRVELRSWPINIPRMIVPYAVDTGTQQYDRFIAHLCYNAAPFSIQIEWIDLTQNSVSPPPLHLDADYTLSLVPWDGGDPVATATYHTSADGKKEVAYGAVFSFDTLPPSGCYLGWVAPADEHALPFPITILHPGDKQQHVLFYEGDFQWVHDHIADFHVAVCRSN